MDLAHGRASLELRSDIGAASPGRWQPEQSLKRIGATSRLNVTDFVALEGPSALIAPTITRATAMQKVAAIAVFIEQPPGKEHVDARMVIQLNLMLCTACVNRRKGARIGGQWSVVGGQ